MAERIVNGYLLGAVRDDQDRQQILGLTRRLGPRDDRGFTLSQGVFEAFYDPKLLKVIGPNHCTWTQRCNARKAAEDGYVSRDTPFGGY